MPSSRAKDLMRRSSVSRVYPCVTGQDQGKAVHEAEGASPGLIGDCGRHAFRIEGLDAKAKSEQVLSVITAQVDEFLVEQKVRHGELKA